jgi:hypothetical protein
MTALPRAAAPPDKRWRHVALHPVQDSETTVFSTTGTPLADGAELVSTLDVDHHLLRIVAGSDRVNFDLLKGPSPHAVGSAIADLARGHGLDAEIDESRYPDTNDQVYEQWHAKAWLDNTVWVVDTFSVLNTGIEGETAGPHLWSHGFDIATEWFSKKIVAGDEEGNAQIAVGFYPVGDAYFYANPWPFDGDWTDARLPPGAVWHTDGWEGAMLPASELGAGDQREQVLVFARSVHELAHHALS